MPPPSPHEPLRLSADDLYSPRVEAFLDEQAMLNRAMPEVEPQPWILRVLYSSYFYLSLASGLGAFVAWMIIEPFFSESDRGEWTPDGPSSCSRRSRASSGLFLGAAEGIMCRNLQRALICAAVGLGIGFAGRAGRDHPRRIIFAIMIGIAVSVSGRTPSRARCRRAWPC